MRARRCSCCCGIDAIGFSCAHPGQFAFYTELSMSYAEAVEQLNAMVPELYQGSGEPRRKFSLDEIRLLLDGLGDPHRRFPSVLIAGTTGKGSTAATLGSIPNS